MVKCKVKTVMTLDNRADNGVKECGVKRKIQALLEFRKTI